MLAFNLSEWREQMQKSVLEVFGGQEPLSAEGEQRMSIHPSDLWRSWMRSDGGGKLDWVHPGYICNAMWSELS